MVFWSVGRFWYMVYGIWYVVYGMKMAFTVYLYMFHMCRAWGVYNIVHLFLVIVISFEFNVNIKLLQGIDALCCRKPECDACKTYVNTL